jgi:2-amino-4-hydroxy-6-hydroxymethyldihydropteridine diphosphokinase
VTAPWGFISENDFLNAVLCSESLLFPLEILKETQKIEYERGRVNKSVDGIYQDRLIDIDLLLYDRLIMRTQQLTLPHPLMSERLFVMAPMAEIAPEMIHPVLGKKMKEILHSMKKT